MLVELFNVVYGVVIAVVLASIADAVCTSTALKNVVFVVNFLTLWCHHGGRRRVHVYKERLSTPMAVEVPSLDGVPSRHCGVCAHIWSDRHAVVLHCPARVSRKMWLRAK